MADLDLLSFVVAEHSDDETRAMVGQTQTGCPRFDTLAALVAIAHLIRAARRARLAGRIDRASVTEAAIDLRIAALPASVQW